MATTGFGGLPEEFCTEDNSAVAIIPAPYDGTSTWIKGADKGPSAILEASPQLEYYDIETGTEVYKRGIYTVPPIQMPKEPEEMVSAVKTTVLNQLKRDKFCVTLGGEHSISVGAFQAHYEQFEEKHDSFCVLQLDAHADLRDTYLGSKYNHACVMARIKEVCPIVQVGIRSMDIAEKELMDEERCFYAHSLEPHNNDWDQIINCLDQSVYITLDLDVFDPSILPSTGTPEPGGLLWYQTLSLLKAVFKQKNVLGFDIVELCPNPQNKASDFLAAKLIYKLLSYKFDID
ncbi:MAG: agmatinase [Fibrobacteria bacterium]|nr:agmatinase [Fibrobacteria bacterium]